MSSFLFSFACMHSNLPMQGCYTSLQRQIGRLSLKWRGGAGGSLFLSFFPFFYFSCFFFISCFFFFIYFLVSFLFLFCLFISIFIFFYFIFFFFSSCFLFIFSYFFCFVFFFLSFYSCLFLFYFFYFSNFTFISLYFLSGTALGVPLNNGEPSLKSPHRNELSLTMQEN
jgi:hypothetical protein